MKKKGRKKERKTQMKKTQKEGQEGRKEERNKKLSRKERHKEKRNNNNKTKTKMQTKKTKQDMQQLSIRNDRKIIKIGAQRAPKSRKWKPGAPPRRNKTRSWKKYGIPLTRSLHFGRFWWKMGAKMEAKIH